MACEDPARQDGHLILIGQEPLPGVNDALLIVADLESDDRADVKRNALPGHTRLRDLGLAHGQGQETGLAEKREHISAVTGNNAERRAVVAMSAASNQHGLVGRRHAVTEHVLIS